MQVDLRHFRAFLTVARLGSFTRAAAQLHVSQPALTVQIRQLEEALGLRLFDRNNRRVLLTASGQQLVGPAERLLAEFDGLVRDAGDLSARRRGVVTIAVLPSVAADLLPDVLRELSTRHAGLDVRLHDVVAGRVVEMVKNLEVDFGIGSLDRPDPDLRWKPIVRDRLCAFVPAGRRVPRGGLSLEALGRQPLILTSRDSSVRQLVERTLARRRVAARVAYSVTYMSSALALVRAGLGVAILPESAGRAADTTGARAVPIREPLLTRDIGVISHAERSLSPAAAAVVDLLEAMVSRRRNGSPGTS